MELKIGVVAIPCSTCEQFLVKKMNSEDNAHYNQLFYWIIISTNYMRGTAFMGICEGKFMDQHYCFTTCILAQIFQDSDASIRKRALELVYLLVNESNVKSLTKELIEYLEVSDRDFKGDLTAKICSIVEKFSTEKIWYIDQMLKVLSEMVFDVQMWI
ncbi:hypothetical protein ACSBR2_036713 [Camellia fascicularis]